MVDDNGRERSEYIFESIKIQFWKFDYVYKEGKKRLIWYRYGNLINITWDLENNGEIILDILGVYWISHFGY